MIASKKSHDLRSAAMRSRFAVITCAALLITGAATAQRSSAPEEALIINAVSSKIDDATKTADFRNVTVSQGTRRLKADRARAVGLGVQNSEWTFIGRVAISLEPRSLLLADQAIVLYRDGKLAEVRATGSPAYFEQQRPDAQPPRSGHADVIIYDAKQESVHLEGHAQLSDGLGQVLSAPVADYSIRDDMLRADSATESRGVHLKISP
jgi:lipopolysaccharide transport protein LptA